MDKPDRLPLSVHHIGGRAGTRCFPILPVFERDIVNVLYEADRSSLAGIRAATKDLPSETIILGDCVSGKAGPRPFHIYSNRYLSSLFPLSARYTGNYSFDAQFGWDDDPIGKSLVETLTLDTVTLDQIIEREAGRVPPPNFLSLDTQGSELEILEGGANTIESDVVAIMSEVEFVPIYQDQPLFGDIVSFLDGKGFELASLEIFPTAGASNRTPIGLRGKGFPQGGEALFLRRPETLGDHPDRNTLLLKLAFISFVFNFFDRTHEIISGLEDHAVPVNGQELTENLSYLVFLKMYGDITKTYPDLFPVDYSDIWPTRQSAARFKNGFRTVDYEAIHTAYVAARDPAEFMQDLSKLLSDDLIGVEALAARFHLNEQAELLRENRQGQIDSVLKWLRMERTTTSS
jgi:FkbM family methyltransferase